MIFFVVDAPFLGDHKQLRPPTTTFHLAKDYHLDISLFERLIVNKVQYCHLDVQHRMRPEVVRLIVPFIYQDLRNSDSVQRYPSVRGMKRNVFFLTHDEKEMSEHDGKSHVNPYEVDMALALARHLVMQGYKTEQITILTTYSGQVLHFRKIRKNHASLAAVKIATVDNFQGEENVIIILSLVRNNEAGVIGFLKTENRICVALSRAKQGFYLLGNMDNLQNKSKLWNNISGVLQSNAELGSKFTLHCDIHNTVTEVSNN